MLAQHFGGWGDRRGDTDGLSGTARGQMRRRPDRVAVDRIDVDVVTQIWERKNVRLRKTVANASIYTTQ